VFLRMKTLLNAKHQASKKLDLKNAKLELHVVLMIKLLQVHNLLII